MVCVCVVVPTPPRCQSIALSHPRLRRPFRIGLSLPVVPLVRFRLTGAHAPTVNGNKRASLAGETHELVGPKEEDAGRRVETKASAVKVKQIEFLSGWTFTA